MKEKYYEKFINFLKEKNLYDDMCLDYFMKQTNFVYNFDVKNDFSLEHSNLVYDEYGNLMDIILNAPVIRDDVSVMINVNAYVQMLLFIPKLNKEYIEDNFNCYVMPLFYEKLYSFDSSDEVLLEYERKRRINILRGNNSFYQFALKYSEDLFLNYRSGKSYMITKKMHSNRRDAVCCLQRKKVIQKKF